MRREHPSWYRPSSPPMRTWPSRVGSSATCSKHWRSCAPNSVDRGSLAISDNHLILFDSFTLLSNTPATRLRLALRSAGFLRRFFFKVEYLNEETFSCHC